MCVRDGFCSSAILLNCLDNCYPKQRLLLCAPCPSIAPFSISDWLTSLKVFNCKGKWGGGLNKATGSFE